MKRLLYSVFICFIFIFSLILPCSAFTTSTNYDVFGNNSTCINLLSLLPDDFNGDYVVFRTDYSISNSNCYYLFYGDISYNSSNNTITSNGSIDYIRQLSTSSGYTYTMGSQSLTLTCNNVVCTTLDDVPLGSISYTQSSYNTDKLILLVVLIFCPILLFANLWGLFKHDYY